MSGEHAAILIALLGAVPGVLSLVRGMLRERTLRDRAGTEARQVASRTTREEFEALYAEQRRQLEEARRETLNCRNTCTTLQLSLDLARESTEAQAVRIGVLERELQEERQAREAIEWQLNQIMRRRPRPAPKPEGE